MSIYAALTTAFPDRFLALILDNEVTVAAFVTEPPLPWARLTAQDGAYAVAAGYPGFLDAAQADAEELNWDQVDLGLLRDSLRDPAGIDLIAIGNNAAQGFPLASALPRDAARDSGAVIYGSSLPEQARYEALGFSTFCPRGELLQIIAERAGAAGKKPALGFINTIQHNDENYHHPWPGR